MSAPAGDRLPLVLRFAAERHRGLAAGFAALLRHPAQACAVLRALAVGKRLRARQALAALSGIDHRLALPGLGTIPTEPASALKDHGIDRPSAPTGASVVLLGAAGHELIVGAGAQIAEAFRGDAGLQALYSDALAAIGEGDLLPILRPAFDADYLRGIDYVGPVVALRRSSLDAIGSPLDPEQPALDALLRIDARFGPGAVRHLPRLLSLWRVERGGEGTASRLACIARDLARRGRGDVVAQAEPDGSIRIVYPLPEPRPLVSLIVPTRDRVDLLRPCLTSLIERTDWPAKEILVVDNDSREPETLAYFRTLEARGLARIVPHPGQFDFAAMNNAAAGIARGRLLAFVNNDVEAFRPDWLERMVREALRAEIGAVGAKLLDGRGRIQHGGVVLGTGGLVTHGHRHFSGNAPGYLGALTATHRVSAVTAACLVVGKDKFAAVGGFDATCFAVDFNDVDLCLRLNAAGFRTLLVPGAVLHHREAASRRRTPASEARHRREIAAFEERWGPLLVQDPHYHPGFHSGLSTHARLRAGWTGAEPAGIR